MIKSTRGSMLHNGSLMLVQAEEMIRSFFREQFNESPRLLKLELIEDSIHVHGYRSLTQAEVRAMAENFSSNKMQRYHESLVKSARKMLKEKLKSGLQREVVEVGWFLDAAQHEFDIVISLREIDNQHVVRTITQHTNQQRALQ